MMDHRGPPLIGSLCFRALLSRSIIWASGVFGPAAGLRAAEVPLLEASLGAGCPRAEGDSGRFPVLDLLGLSLAPSPPSRSRLSGHRDLPAAFCDLRSRTRDTERFVVVDDARGTCEMCRLLGTMEMNP